MSNRNRQQANRLPPSARSFPPEGAQVKNLAVGEAIPPGSSYKKGIGAQLEAERVTESVTAPAPEVPVAQEKQPENVRTGGIFGGYPDATSDWYVGAKGKL